MNGRGFLAELKRRNVYKVAIAYAAVGWLLIQVATQVFPFFEVPGWSVRLVVLFVIVGFPIALLIAWAFELTPEGIKRTEEADAAPAAAARAHCGGDVHQPLLSRPLQRLKFSREKRGRGKVDCSSSLRESER